MSNGNINYEKDPYMDLINTIGNLTKHRDSEFTSTAYNQSKRMVNNWIGLMKNLDLKDTASITKVERLIDSDWNRVSGTSEELKLTLESDYNAIKDNFLSYKDANTVFYQAFGDDGYYQKDNDRLMEILELAGKKGIMTSGELKEYSDELSSIVSRYNKDRVKLDLMFKNDYKYMTEYLPQYERQHEVIRAVSKELTGRGLEVNEATALSSYLDGTGDIQTYQAAHNTNIAEQQSIMESVKEQFKEDSAQFMRLDAIQKYNIAQGENHPYLSSLKSIESPNPMAVEGVGYVIDPNTKEKDKLYWFLPEEMHSASELEEMEEEEGFLGSTYQSMTQSDLDTQMMNLKGGIEGQLRTYDIQGKDLQLNSRNLINSMPHLFDESTQKAYLPWQTPTVGKDDFTEDKDKDKTFTSAYKTYETPDDIKDASGERVDWRKKRINKLSKKSDAIVNKMNALEESIIDSKGEYNTDMDRLKEIEEDIKDRWDIAREEGKAEETGIDKALKAIGYVYPGGAPFTYREVRRRAYATESGKEVRKLEEEKERIIQKWTPTTYSGKYTTKEERTKYQKEISHKQLEYKRLQKEYNKIKKLILGQETSIREIS